MSDMTEYAFGQFCWADAGTTDVDAAKRFYAEVLGWTFNDTPMGEGASYSIALVGGKPAAAIYPQQPQMRAQGVPPFWLSYINVTSVDEVAAKVEGLGGKVMMPPFDVMDAGRMTIIQDPTGAGVGLWQAKGHIGARVLGDTGAMCWHELVTTDTDKAAAFFKGLLGWGAEAKDMGGMIYTVFSAGEKQVGGMMKITPEMGPIPPNWVVYYAVDDCDAAVDRATRLGGKALMPPTEVPTVGRFAPLQDPQGAAFAVIKFAAPAK